MLTYVKGDEGRTIEQLRADIIAIDRRPNKSETERALLSMLCTILTIRLRQGDR
jgi:hypothetical protein